MNSKSPYANEASAFRQALIDAKCLLEAHKESPIVKDAFARIMASLRPEPVPYD